LQATGLDFVKLLNDNLEEDADEEQKIFRQTSISVSTLTNISYLRVRASKYGL
jgi:hypothetical protein